jgi:hypothetical protein
MMIRNGLYFRYSGDAARTVEQRGQFATLIYTLGNLPLTSLALIAIERRRAGRFRSLFWVLCAAEVAWALPSGERARIVSLGLLFLVVRYYESDRAFPWRRVALGAILVLLVVFPFGTYYRGPGGQSGYQAAPAKQLMRASSDLVRAAPRLPILSFDDTLSRFSDAASLASITTQGRGRYPSTARQTATSWLQALVPRFVMPSKADPSRVGNEFGRAYGIIFRTSQASISVTYVGDLYGSFGLFGVILGMLGVGLIVRALDEYLASRSTDPLITAIFATMIGAFLLRQESTIAVGLIQSIKDLFLYAIVTGGVALLSRNPVANTTSVRTAARAI